MAISPERNSPVESVVGIGFSDKLLVGVSMVGFCMLAWTVYSILRFQNKQLGYDDDKDLSEAERWARADVSTLTRAQRRARANAIMKEQRRIVFAAAEARDGENEIGNHDGAEENLAVAVVPPVDFDDNDDGTHIRELRPVLSRKERQQAAKAAEKEERRLFQGVREKQQKEAQFVAQQQKQQRLAAAAIRVEQEKQLQLAEMEARDKQERKVWSIFLTASSASTQNTESVGEFMEKCKSDRIVCMDEIATTFGVEVSSVAERIQKLLQENRIAGFFQKDRFIYVSDDELSLIASTVSEHGSISLEQITAICQRVICG